MASHGTNTNEEVQLLREELKKQGACIAELQGQVFETYAAKEEEASRISQGAAYTEPERSAAAVRLTILRQQLNAKQEEVQQANGKCEGLRTERKMAIEAMTTVVDTAHSALDRVKEEKRFTYVEKFNLFDTALNEIADKGREYLQRANWILQSEQKAPQSYKEAISSLMSTPKAGLSDHQPKDVQAPASAAAPQPQAPRAAPKAAPKVAPKVVSTPSGSNATTGPSAQRPRMQEPKPIIPPTDPKSFPPLVQSISARERKDVAPAGPVNLPMPKTGKAQTLLPVSAVVPIPSIAAAVLRAREARTQAKAASTLISPAPSGVSSEKETREIQDTKEGSNVLADKDVDRSRDTTSNTDRDCDVWRFDDLDGEDLYGVSDDEASKTRINRHHRQSR